jgi:hypothetical protein
MIKEAVGNARLCAHDDEPIWICARDTRKIRDACDDDAEPSPQFAGCPRLTAGFTPMSYMNTEDKNNCMNFLCAEVVIDASWRAHGELTTSYGEEKHKSLRLDWPNQLEHCTAMESETIRLAYMEIWEGTVILDELYQKHFQKCAEVTSTNGQYENWMAHVELHADPDGGLDDVPTRAGVLTKKLISMLADSNATWKQKVVNGSAHGMYVPTWSRKEQEENWTKELESQLDEALEPHDAIGRTHLPNMLRFDCVSPILWGAVRYTQM